MALQTLTEEDREYYFMLSGMVESVSITHLNCGRMLTYGC